jgi:dTDP-4-dehydrorhamnose 3,5-epimerase
MHSFERIFPNCYLIKNQILIDARGGFCKKFTRKVFDEIGFDFNISEEFYTTSFKDVIRGMHFTIPPFAQSKIVYCVNGLVLDVLLDLRPGSNYGKFKEIVLDSRRPSLLIIPIGVAHGFKSMSDNSILVYKTDCEYHVDFDSGIRYDSFGYDWGLSSPVISERDSNLLEYKDFKTPFNET